MKLLIIAIFAVAFLSSLLWFDSGERNYTAPQRALLAVMALTGWSLVLLLGVAQL